MRIARWIPTTKNAHSEYIILIVFTLQQWLHEHASMLRYAYSARLVHGDQNVSVHLMITIQKVTSNVQRVPRRPPGPKGP
jgi:hypothetical protein